MKKFFKKNIKIIISFVTGILLASGTAYAVIVTSSNNVSFTPSNTTWNVNNVESALNSLYQDSLNNYLNGYNAGKADSGGYDLIYFNQKVKPAVTYTFNKAYKLVLCIAMGPSGSGLAADCTFSGGTASYFKTNNDNYTGALYRDVPKGSTVRYCTTSTGNNPSGSDNYEGIPSILIGIY